MDAGSDKGSPAEATGPRPGSGVCRWIASGLGLGYLRPMPGTYASAATALCAGALAVHVGWAAVAGLALGLTALALALAGRCERDFGSCDPRQFVLDEAAGQTVALFGLAGHPSPTWWGVAAAFGLFRLFDVLKPCPIFLIDRCRNRFGVVGDDLAAGALAALVLALASRLV